MITNKTPQMRTFQNKMEHHFNKFAWISEIIQYDYLGIQPYYEKITNLLPPYYRAEVVLGILSQSVATLSHKIFFLKASHFQVLPRGATY